MSESAIFVRKFSDINLNDPFFDDLKVSYARFTDWFSRKASDDAYVSYSTDGRLQGFLYLKLEQGPIKDITPPLNVDKALKVGTFKVVSHGTRMGERFVKIIVDTVLNAGLRIAYLTIFPKHEPLIRILETFGFRKAAEKNGPDGCEDVYVKDLQYLSGDPQFDYPVVDSRNHSKWLMAIYAAYHTDLFPDSILKTEKLSIIQDTSYTNSIHKIYVGAFRDFSKVSRGDCLVIYRCVEKDHKKKAWYGSVATSLCIVEDIRPASAFETAAKFIDFCERYSVFDPAKLKSLYSKHGMYAVMMTYNLAFPKRPTLGNLVEAGVVPHPGTGCYMGFLPLSDMAFKRILELGGVHAGFVIY